MGAGSMGADPVAYLDHAASTPMRPEAVAAMLPYLTETYANPTGAHAMARRARQAIDEARDEVAACLAVDPGEIVFCGDGTEADNLAVLGIAAARRTAGTPGAVVCSAVEHHAVLHPTQHLGGTVVKVDRSGIVDLDQLADAIGAATAVVSVMAVNNEVGTVQPMAEIAAVVRANAPQAVLHTDAVQAHTWIDTAELARHVDALSISGHKFGGPKGVGVLWLRRGVPLEPLVLGGGQERGRRSGTHNVGGIVALATAMRITAACRTPDVTRITALRDRLVDGVVAAVPGVVETVPRHLKVAGNAHLCVEGVESEALLYLLERAGVMASAGSSCSSGAVELSHVLAAMGVARTLGMGALRFSLGPASCEADVDRALEAIVPAVRQLRRA